MKKRPEPRTVPIPFETNAQVAEAYRRAWHEAELLRTKGKGR